MTTTIELEVKLEGIMVPAKPKPSRSNAYDYEPAYIDKFKIMCHNVDITSLVDQRTYEQALDEYMIYLEKEHH